MADAVIKARLQFISSKVLLIRLRDSNDWALYKAYCSKTSVGPIFSWDDEMIPRCSFWIEVTGQLG